jgi:hypothetical protein
MTIYTVCFEYPNRSKYSTLLKVFEKSCQVNMPDAKFICKHIAAPENPTNRALNFKYNTVKLKLWTEFLEKTKEKHVILADCDMLALKDARYAFNNDFDIAYTKRTKISRIPINGGIVFVKVNRRSIEFFKEWLRINVKMFKNPKFHQQYRRKYAGMNQSAFGYLLEKRKDIAKLKPFKTCEFNAVDCDWPTLDGKTVFLHCKSKLRKMVLGEKKGQVRYKKCIDIWHKYHGML